MHSHPFSALGDHQGTTRSGEAQSTTISELGDNLRYHILRGPPKHHILRVGGSPRYQGRPPGAGPAGTRRTRPARGYRCCCPATRSTALSPGACAVTCSHSRRLGRTHIYMLPHIKRRAVMVGTQRNRENSKARICFCDCSQAYISMVQFR